MATPDGAADADSRARPRRGRRGGRGRSRRGPEPAATDEPDTDEIVIEGEARDDVRPEAVEPRSRTRATTTRDRGGPRGPRRDPAAVRLPAALGPRARRGRRLHLGRPGAPLRAPPRRRGVRPGARAAPRRAPPRARPRRPGQRRRAGSRGARPGFDALPPVQPERRLARGDRARAGARPRRRPARPARLRSAGAGPRRRGSGRTTLLRAIASAAAAGGEAEA